MGGGYEHSIMRPSHQLKVDVRSGGTGLGRGTRNEFSSRTLVTHLLFIAVKNLKHEQVCVFFVCFLFSLLGFLCRG